jgi:quercetin dioxygenase-like cupin family protein
MVSGKQGTSETMTVGRCYIRPGAQNPRHDHPNCDEVLHVLQGRILHSVDDEVEEMGPGDTVSIPSGALHNARNIGDEEAVFVIAFSSADRLTVGE